MTTLVGRRTDGNLAGIVRRVFYFVHSLDLTTYMNLLILNISSAPFHDGSSRHDTTKGDANEELSIYAHQGPGMRLGAHIRRVVCNPFSHRIL